MSKLLGILILTFGAAATVTSYAAPRDSFEARDRVATTTAAAPEIDPASAFSALTLLGASVAVIRSRRRK
jgi:hypothetical protein